MATPEGKIKAKINDVLREYGSALDPWMPVPGGYGESRLDYCICYCGRYIAIEAKAPGKKPTDRQRHNIARLERAGARVFVISDDEGVEELRGYLARLTFVGNLYKPLGV